ncbi:DUF2958 domain-containing protein [Sphingomonas sanxanigenens]|uniref:Single-stranded DNA endonuclease n=1 Tax=Sphingomonas sanxanigenens DSM 19645 = NX02 TaxID=1123269 RepID=W0AIV0_9SPHN|nr:DUF2958 domain-containing protein [Sphingomonas sanxanigenens]AHE55580.1 hypothetical protein NX02_19605 [Sphingomonas sanxanigenens DSM 19645 = NX02]
MILLTPELHAALRVNADRSAASDHDPVPVVKFFSPMGAATWLATELYVDGDTLFGLADLGFGCPELGCFSLSELASMRLPFGLRIERDIGFSTTVSLSVWADTARRAGSISQAQSIIWRIESAPVPELPTDPEGGNGG